MIDAVLLAVAAQASLAAVPERVCVDPRTGYPNLDLGVITVPSMFMNALPYILTVIILAGFVGRAIPPRAGGEPYVKER